MQEEIWLPIEGFEDYQVSNFGRVKSFNTRNGETIILKPTPNKDGYPSVKLYKRGKHKQFRIHRLVAICFIENPLNKPEVNHINGIKTDNRSSNLEWVMRAENIRHAYKTGLNKAQQGEENGRAKLTSAQIELIRENPDNLTGRFAQALNSLLIESVTINEMKFV